MRGIRKIAGSLYKRLARPFTYRHDVYYRKGKLWLLNRETMMDEGFIKFKNYEDKLIYKASHLIEQHQITHLFDIGANLGYYTVQLGGLQQIRKIHSFEPFPDLYLQIGANVLINGLTEKWHGHQCALSDHEGSTTLHYHPYYLGTSSLDPEWTDRASESIQVPAQRFDDLVDCTNERCYVKIDVEGNEPSTLTGMKRFLSRNTILLQIEITPKTKKTVFMQLKEQGFSRITHLGENDYLAANSDLQL